MSTIHPILIRNAEVNGDAALDVLIANGLIMAIGANLPIPDVAEVFDAAGGALLPGLRDHHLHLASLAVAHESLACSPAEVGDHSGLALALQDRAKQQPEQWIRGIGYSETMAADFPEGINAAWLDAHIPDVPVRIQHRGGRLWVLNTAALKALQVTDSDPVERVDGQCTGRLYEADVWLRQRLNDIGQGGFPSLSAISRQLASYGITGITDTTPNNNLEALRHFETARSCGELLQAIRIMGDYSLDAAETSAAGISIGEHKFHLLESALPDLSQLVAHIANSHVAGRNVAFHCVTRAELVFALAALKEAGSRAGDRIEHASVTPPDLLPLIKALGLTVVTQPGLIAERGDHYLTNVDADDKPWLYRLKAFLEAGIPLAGSSDAPYTQPNPWLGMQAAIDRTTSSGEIIGQDEALSAQAALWLYTGTLEHPGEPITAIQTGMLADACLLSQSWAVASADLANVQIQLTLCAGNPIWRRP